ncbi:MAG TPA: hypothetical protein VGE39_05460 [Prosthecobacter sp.]
MKRFALFFCLALCALGLSSCDTYVDGGYAYRSGYARPGYTTYRPGYVRPGYSRPSYSYNRNYYNTPSRSYYRPSSYHGRHDHDHGRRDWDGRRDNDRSRYYRSSGARTNTRVNVGPVGLSNANWMRF